MTIDIDVIMQGMLELLEAKKEDGLWNNVSGVELLKDYRTIGLTIPRQSGATHYLLEQLKNNEDAILIVSEGLYKALKGELLLSLIGRIYTPVEIQRAIRLVRSGQQDHLLANVNLVLIDSGVSFFEYVRRNKFYQWLFTRSGEELTVVVFN